MYRFKRTTLVVAGICALISCPALALDARTAALGGSAIANARGAYGAFENPSSLMRMRRDGQVVHFHMGISIDLQDDGGYIATANDNEDLLENIDDELDALTGRTLTCNENSTPETVCLVDTGRLGEYSARILTILEDVDGQPLSGTGAADFGVAYTKWSIPIAIHYKTSVTGAAITRVEPGDKDYIATFADVLADDQLTYDELFSAVPLTVSPDGQTLSVLQPEDALQSGYQATGMTREQIGLSMATSAQLAGINVDFGFTPKFSELKSTSLIASFNERFDDDSDTVSDQFRNNETIATSWNADLGVSAILNDAPITVSAVARNLFKESITTKENFVFDTTPQLIVGGAYQLERFTVSADMALNEAKIDNMKTQILAVGVEFAHPIFGIRAGMSHDTARTGEATALSLGFSLGPLHVGGRVTNTDKASAQAGAQIAFSF